MLLETFPTATCACLCVRVQVTVQMPAADSFKQLHPTYSTLWLTCCCRCCCRGSCCHCSSLLTICVCANLHSFLLAAWPWFAGCQCSRPFGCRQGRRCCCCCHALDPGLFAAAGIRSAADRPGQVRSRVFRCWGFTGFRDLVFM
jgi:hypothetical protein